MNNRPIQTFLNRNEKYLVWLGWGTVAAVGLMQMYHVSGGFITNQGADIIAPVMLYHATRTNKTVLSRFLKKGLNEPQTFALILTLCLGWETLQQYDLSGTPLVIVKGTFDPLDILTYFITLLVCYYFDVTRIKEAEKQ